MGVVQSGVSAYDCSNVSVGLSGCGRGEGRIECMFVCKTVEPCAEFRGSDGKALGR